MLYRLQTSEPPKHYCHHCGASVPDNEDFCLRCGACANCGLLAAEISHPTAPHAFCPNCGARLQLKRPAQGVALLLYRLSWGLAIGSLALLATAAALAGTCALLFMAGAPGIALPILLGAAVVGGLSGWAISALNRWRP